MANSQLIQAGKSRTIHILPKKIRIGVDPDTSQYGTLEFQVLIDGILTQQSLIYPYTNPDPSSREYIFHRGFVTFTNKTFNADSQISVSIFLIY
jgi:hypothetical protein